MLVILSVSLVQRRVTASDRTLTMMFTVIISVASRGIARAHLTDKSVTVPFYGKLNNNQLPTAL